MEHLWRAAWAEHPRLQRVARRRCRNRADAEDIVAEAIVRCVTHPGLDPARLPAMLTATTVRLCVDTLRARLVAERNAPRLFTRPADTTDEVVDRAAALWLALQTSRLGEMEQAALLARALGLTVSETAELLDVTYRAAEGLLGRARRKMRARWARGLAVLWPRRRGSWFLLATAGALAVAAGQMRVPDRPSRAVERAVRAGGGEVPEVVPDLRLVPPARPRARASQAAPVSRSVRSLTTPDVRLGPIRAHPSVVTLDLSDPVGRVRRCVRDGVQVERGGRYGLTCRE